jgi:hypothetical protein
MKRLFACLALVIAVFLPQGSVASAPEPQGYDKFGIVVTGIDTRFNDAVTVMVHPETNINRPGPDGRDVSHVHFYRVPEGGLGSLVGRAFIVEVQGSQDADGKHWYVYAMEETSPQVALELAGIEEDNNTKLSYEEQQQLVE